MYRIGDDHKIGNEYTFGQVTEAYARMKNDASEDDVLEWVEFGKENILGANSIRILDRFSEYHWFILSSASGSVFYYKYVYRG